jgi:hypothetical protein
MEIIFGILIIYCCLATFIVINLLRKNEKLEDTVEQADVDIEGYETWFATFRLKVLETYNKMKEVDRKGSFEADDEIGFIFKELKQVMEDLNTHVLGKETDGRDQTEEKD